jgi:cytochrome c oxidase assembly protein subunit 15
MLTAVLAAWIWARETNGWPRRIGLIAILATMGLLGVRTQPMFIALAGVAVLVILFSSFQLIRDRRGLRWWAAIAFSAVLIQGVLGGLRVTAMKDELGIFHATLAQVFFVLLCAIAVATSPWWSRPLPLSPFPKEASILRRAYPAVTLLILGQLVLGATMRHQHAGLAIPDFPAAYGKVWPATDPVSVARYNQERGEVRALNPVTAGGILLQMAHRLMALVIVLAVAWLAGATLRRWGARSVPGRLTLLWLGLLLAQAGLGMATIWTHKAADIATAHVAVGALSLMTGTLLSLVVARHPRAIPVDQDSSLTREPVHFDARPVRASA